MGLVLHRLPHWNESFIIPNQVFWGMQKSPTNGKCKHDNKCFSWLVGEECTHLLVEFFDKKHEDLTIEFPGFLWGMLLRAWDNHN